MKEHKSVDPRHLCGQGEHCDGKVCPFYIVLIAFSCVVFLIGLLFILMPQGVDSKQDSNAVRRTGMESPVSNNPAMTVSRKESSQRPLGGGGDLPPEKTDIRNSISEKTDRRVNSYAEALQKTGTLKRIWNTDDIEVFSSVKHGGAARFELVDGVMAEGTVKVIQFADGEVTYVSGELIVPEKGRFFFQKQSQPGMAGAFAGLVEFPGSETAYRIEPTGPGGTPEMVKRDLDECVCLRMPLADVQRLQLAALDEIPPLNPEDVPDVVPSYNDNIVSLQSRPGATGVLYIDYRGGYTPTWGGITYERPNVSNEQIKDVWKRVCEDYMAFDINVTTDIRVYEAAPENSRQRVIVSATNTAAPGAGGVAYIGSWNWTGDTPCWAFYTTGKAAAEVIAHEAGHTLTLGHDGRTSPEEGYYAGQGSGETGWAPIMGVGYYQPVVQWCKGEYLNANNGEDDLFKITAYNNSVTYRADDTGAALATARYLEIDTDFTASAEGVIEQTADTDAFRFTTSGGQVDLSVTPVGDWADLAIQAVLADATGNIIASNSPQSTLGASITANLAPGTYTFCVTGAGRNDPLTDGFSNYASLGYYSVEGTVESARLPTRLSVPEHAANSFAVGSVVADNPNGSPLNYAITSGNTDGTFSVDNSGVVRVADNTLLDYQTLAADTMLTVQFELFMDIVNVNDPGLTELNRRVVITVEQLYPPVPWYLEAASVSGLRISLEWPDSTGATRYNVKRSLVPGGPYTTVATPEHPCFTDSALTDGVNYCYVVSAVNANGESGNSPEVNATAQAVANFSFESPDIGAGNYIYNPSGGSWTFGGSPGNGSGIVADGSAFGNPDASEGNQAAFIQSYGVIDQVLSGFVPGSTCTITYSAAQRSGSNGGESWNVEIDGEVVQSNDPGGTSYTDYTAVFTATSITHRVSFAGTDLAGGDNTVFIDNIRISIFMPPLSNNSFEEPVIGGGAFQYNPSDFTWTFSGASPDGSGIIANGSAFSNPSAPDGVQAAFVQEYGTLTRSLTGLVPGVRYTLHYLAAQRSGVSQHGGESWNVEIDGEVVQENTPGGTSYTECSASFVASDETHTLGFVGTDLAGGDNTVFIDKVSLTSTLYPEAPYVSIVSPIQDQVFVVPGTIDIEAAVLPNGNRIECVQFFSSYPGTLIGEVTNAPFIYAWTDGTEGGQYYSIFARVFFNDSSWADSDVVTFVTMNRDPDFGFELPDLGGGNYAYSPSGGCWTFGGSVGSGSGIVANGSAFGNPDAPEGDQAAFVQSYGVIDQLLSGFVPGAVYTITYMAAQRSGSSQHGGESWNVEIDGEIVQENSPGGTSYAGYAAVFTATSLTHRLSFTGTDLAGGDNTVFIDNVTIDPPLSAPVVTEETLPATTLDVEGGDVTFSAAFAGYSPIFYQWQKLEGETASNIAGATNTMLAMTGLQLADAGSYRLQASNDMGVASSTPVPLSVSSVPAAVNNVITKFAAQTGYGPSGEVGASFTPTWSVVTDNNLIAGKAPESAGGDFSLEIDGRSVLSLTDGEIGAVAVIERVSGITTSTNLVTCGNGSGAGYSVVYDLPDSAAGYNLTNITVYGGWRDAGRDMQAYTVYYSTVIDPATFRPLGSVSINPVNSASVQCATRVKLVPESGSLASNVASVWIDFSNPGSENGFCGYSEIALFGDPAQGIVPQSTTPTNIVVQVTDGHLMLSWPGDHTGWRLQTKTNLLDAMWTDVPGSTGTNLMLVPVNTRDRSFYRMVYP